MNSKASLKGIGWIQLYKKECSLDYSRHLCARKRSVELNNMHNKRHSKLFGYRDTIETQKQRIASGSSDAFQTTHTMPGGQSFASTSHFQAEVEILMPLWHGFSVYPAKLHRNRT